MQEKMTIWQIYLINYNETMLGVEIVDENDIAEDMQLLAEMKD